MKKIKEFFKSELGQKIVYEVKSFVLTFGAVLVSLVGVDKFSSLSVVFNNQDLIIGSLGLAATRTVVIFALRFLGIIDYRQSTINYK